MSRTKHTRSSAGYGSVAVGIFALLVMAEAAVAQKPDSGLYKPATNSSLRMQQQHQKTGTIGGGYRPWSAWTYQQSARTHTQALNAYGQGCKQLPAETAREHLSAIQQNVVATRKEIAKLGDEASKEAEVHEKVVALQKHLEECEELCDMMAKTITEDGVETVRMCAHCSGLEAKLKAAEAQHHAILKEFGIEVPAAAAAHGDHNHAHKTGVPSEKKQ